MVFIVVRFKGIVRTSVYLMNDWESAQYAVQSISLHLQDKLTKGDGLPFDIGIVNADRLAGFISEGYHG